MHVGPSGGSGQAMSGHLHCSMFPSQGLTPVFQDSTYSNPGISEEGELAAWLNASCSAWKLSLSVPRPTHPHTPFPRPRLSQDDLHLCRPGDELGHWTWRDGRAKLPSWVSHSPQSGGKAVSGGGQTKALSMFLQEAKSLKEQP